MPKKTANTPELSDAEKAARRAKNAANRAKREAKAARDKAAQRGSGEAATVAARQDGSRSDRFNIMIVAQAGRLEYEALIFTETLRRAAPGWKGRLIVAEPKPEAAWAGHETRISAPVRDLLEARGAKIRPFIARHFGADYPHGNKIEALSTLPTGENFVFFDSDTLFTGPIERVGFDFNRPSASMRREGTWPEPPLYGPGYGQIWQSLYERFGLDFTSSLDLDQPDEHWERYLYFNAGWFFGSDPVEFRRRFLDWSRQIKREPGEALACQELRPWLDQIALPLVIHSFGGGRPGPELAGLDGDVSCHYRNLPLLYARESDGVVAALAEAAHQPDIRAVLEHWEPALRLIYQRIGAELVRPAFDRERLPGFEQPIRQEIKRAGWWVV